MTATRVWQLALALMWLCAANPAVAQSEPGPEERVDATVSVEVHIVEPLDQPSLRDALKIWFQPDHYSLVLTTEPQLSRAALLAPPVKRDLHIWLSMNQRFISIHLATPGDDETNRRYLLRTLRVPGEVDLLTLEQAAQVAHWASEAILMNNVTTPEQEFFAHVPKEPARSAQGSKAQRPPPQRPTPKARPRPSEPRSVGPQPQIMLNFLTRARGSEPIAVGPGLASAVTWPTRFAQLGPLLRFGYQTPTDAQHGPLKLELEGLEAFIGVLLTSLPSRRTRRASRLHLALGLDAERIRANVVSSDPTLEALPIPTDYRLGVGVEAGLHWLLGSLELGIIPVARWQLFHTNYQVEEPDSLQPVLSSWRIQPGLIVELSTGNGG